MTHTIKDDAELLALCAEIKADIALYDDERTTDEAKEAIYTAQMEKEERAAKIVPQTIRGALAQAEMLGQMECTANGRDVAFDNYPDAAEAYKNLMAGLTRLAVKPEEPLLLMWAEYKALEQQMAEREDKDADADTHPAYERWSELGQLILFTDATTAEGLQVKIEHLTEVTRHSSFAPENHAKMAESLRRSAATVAGKGGAG